MNVAIVGFDVEGRASYDYFSALGDSITICDQNETLTIPAGAQAQLGTGYLDNLDRFDMIIRTPGLHPEAILSKYPSIAEKITSGTNEFLRVCPTKNIIGVTGTKGKGTTSSLITRMLEADGKRVHLGGNIGTAALALLPNIQPDDWVLLELSNFQLIDIKSSPHIAVCLMMVPEHQDWHATPEEYYTAKKQLFLHQTPEDIAIYFKENAVSTDIATASPGTHIPYFTSPGAEVIDGHIQIDNQRICAVEEIRLLGEHNWQNACAAVTAAWQVTKNVPALRQALTTFSGLEHRLEFVREHNGVRYYNDSFGTTPETAIVALQAFSQPKIAILGGSNKGATYDALAAAVASTQVRHAITIGATGPAIADALRAQGVTNIVEGADTMADIVQQASNLAEPGDVVLLSTGCASFGMFANYKDRGTQFKQAVEAL